MLGLMKRVHVADTQKVLLFRDGSFVRVLAPGRYMLSRLRGKLELSWYDVTEAELEHEHLKFLFTRYGKRLEHHAVSVETADTEAALVYVDKRLYDIVAPGRFQAYWRGPQQVVIEKFDVSEQYQVPAHLVKVLRYPGHQRLAASAGRFVRHFEVDEHEVALLRVDGRIEKVLDKGEHLYWSFNRRVEAVVIDRRLQKLEVSGQEILTKDKVSLRLNLVAAYQVVDVRKLADAVADYREHLYLALQLALRDAVGARDLDELLANKGRLNAQIQEEVAAGVGEYGIRLKSVGIKDIILPGEMKEILNQVVAADKAAQANLIKRREETAATRSLMNTAKMLENNPTLLRLKELEALEKITDKIGSITVYGGLDGVLNQLAVVGREAVSGKGPD